MWKRKKAQHFFWLFIQFFFIKINVLIKNRLLFKWRRLLFFFKDFLSACKFLKPFELLMPSILPQCFALLFILWMSPPESPSLPVPWGQGEWPVGPASSSTTNHLISPCPLFFYSWSFIFLFYSFILYFYSHCPSTFPLPQLSQPAPPPPPPLDFSLAAAATDSLQTFFCFRRGSHQSNRDSNHPAILP